MQTIQCLHGKNNSQDIVDKRGCQKSQERLQDPFPEKNCQSENSLQNLQPLKTHQHCLDEY